jgi:hypothetical protein
MKLLIPLLLLFVGSAYADDSSGIWTSESPDQHFFAATREIPSGDDILLWKTEFDGSRLVVVERGADSNDGKLEFTYTFARRLIEQAKWTPDSEYIVFTTSSSGGHSPWHSNSFVFSVADKKLASVDDAVGLVVSPDVSIEASHIATFGIGVVGKDGVDFEHPKKTAVDLSTLFPKGK